MIKRILVGLDPDQDTSFAIDYAIGIARTCGAKITGMAVVDMEHIDSESTGGGIGSMHYAEVLRDKLNKDAREIAHQLIEQFETVAQASEIEFTEAIEEGVPFRELLDDMKYHDLLVIGNKPHFAYNDPEEETDTLVKAIENGISPTLVVTDRNKPIEKVLLAYDGRAPAARAMQQFAQQQPFGNDLDLEIINIHGRDRDDEEESKLLLHLAQSYCEAHGFTVTTSSLTTSDSDSSRILQHAKEIEADLIVAGVHSVSKVKEWMFGSTTSSLLKESEVPLFLYH